MWDSVGVFAAISLLVLVAAWLDKTARAQSAPTRSIDVHRAWEPPAPSHTAPQPARKSAANKNCESRCDPVGGRHPRGSPLQSRSLVQRPVNRREQNRGPGPRFWL